MFQPVRDLVYIRPIFDEQKTNSGLYIPDQAVERCDQGIVQYVGPDCISLKIGDYVLFPNYSGTLMHVDPDVVTGERLIIMREKFIEGVLDMQHELLEINGLYFKSTDGTFNPANYEMCFNLIAESLSLNPHFKEWRVNNRGKRNQAR